MTTRSQLKLELADIISTIAEIKELDSAALAQIIGTLPEKAQQILDGNIRAFSYERLIIFTLRLGYEIQIHVYPSDKSRGNVDMNFTI